MSETKLPVPTAESHLLVWLLDALKPMSRSKVKSLLQRRKIQCACLGTVFNLPMSYVTLTEDLLMVAMAGAMLIV